MRIMQIINKLLLKLEHHIFLRKVSPIIDDFTRHFYNEIRPHCSLEYEVPARVYKPSTREYFENIPRWEYPDDNICRKVKSSSIIVASCVGHCFVHFNDLFFKNHKAISFL